jgi:hypothetical protein
MSKEINKGVVLNVTLLGHERIDFEMPIIRKALMKGAQITRKEARRLVSRKAISGSGDFPGRDSGALFRSIKIISKGRNWVKVGPAKTAEMGEHFYPAFLSYGVTGKPRRKDHKAQVKNGTWRIAPRANYMTEALQIKRLEIQAIIREALFHSLKPRK